MQQSLKSPVVYQAYNLCNIFTGLGMQASGHLIFVVAEHCNYTSGNAGLQKDGFGKRPLITV
jgi:hypothetical protein